MSSVPLVLAPSSVPQFLNKLYWLLLAFTKFSMSGFGFGSKIFGVPAPLRIFALYIQVESKFFHFQKDQYQLIIINNFKISFEKKKNSGIWKVEFWFVWFRLHKFSKSTSVCGPGSKIFSSSPSNSGFAKIHR